MKPHMLDLEKSLWSEGRRFIAGVDEAGRGPLAGDVYAAAVILPPGAYLPGLDDSKRLSEKERERLFSLISETATAYCIAAASVAEIDEHNILGATYIAMNRAIEGLQIAPDIALIDGSSSAGIAHYCRTVVKGDSLSASIAAASVLAKVSRDRYMKRLARIYPGYGFEQHKGYATLRHREAIMRLGPSPVHRRLFLRNLQNG